jgi:quinohemoprotein ethanol dehydrogenase
MPVSVQQTDDGRRPPGRDWTHFGGDWTNARYSTLSQINTQTIKNVGGAWMVKFEANASTRATPMVQDGLMFISAGSRVSALDAKTGGNVWTWRPSEEAPARLEAAGIAVAQEIEQIPALVKERLA